MGELSIRIKVAEREYPMRVDESEEERLRLAGKLLNDRIKFFKDEFKIDDKQDLLAMVAFECFAEKVKTEAESAESNKLLSEKLSSIRHLISSTKHSMNEEKDKMK